MNTLQNMFAKSLAPALLLLSTFLVASSANAETKVQDAWVRATVPGQPSTGAFLKITSDSDSKLVEVQSDVAKLVQIHRSTMEGEIMKMEPVGFVSLPAGKTVSFDPDSYHVMLIDLVRQVKVGDNVHLVMVVETGGKKESIQVDAKARPLDSSSMAH
ncbi:copper chaperone PCu(A)C [Pseudomonas corrugata]|uniref:copper chaperone PCu(A)C n=1 Tax=Pseudomonas corrugata TaxID=47879 RepID=UPI0006D898D5|nr:copper chaperone PCu(A)C [Pseudomonas corrugata]